MMRLLQAFLLLALASQAQADRLVVAGGAITEILYALGVGEQIVAVDSTSRWPERVTELPSIGYVRALSAEGVLAMQPDSILLGHDAGPPAAVEALGRAVPTTQLAPFDSPQALPDGVRELARLVGKEQQGNELAQHLQQQLEGLRHSVDKDARSVLFVLAAGNRGLMVAGKGTAAQAMLDWVGLSNAAAGLTGYKPFSREAMLALQPDVLVVAETEPDSFDLHGHPVLAASPAARSGRVLIGDATWLLSMGPRLPDVLRVLRNTADMSGGL